MLQNAGNHPDIWIREARIAPSECPSYNPCTPCMDSAPRASDSPTLCSDPAPPQECRICRMSQPACSILLLLLLMLKLLLLLLLLLLCWLFAWLLGRVGSLHRVSEWELAGQNTCTGCIDPVRGMFDGAKSVPRIAISGSFPAFWSMVTQICCTGCRDSTLKEARRITAQAGHNLALHELKQIRCTGRADSNTDTNI